jgi:Zn-dependent protease
MDTLEMLKIMPAAVIGLTVHECAHAFAAYKLGDTTAKDQGRLTLNPLKHIDWMGFFLIVVAGFGWAKPVSFNPDNLRHKHRDEILISLAGPFSNLLVAVLFFVLGRLLYGSNPDVANLMLLWGVINIGLFVFNLIPIPPLDGSHLYLTFLKELNPKLMVLLYRYGTLGLLVIILAENFLNINVLHLSDAIYAVAGWILGLLAF